MYKRQNLTGRENLDMIRRILGLPKADVEDALELVGLTEFGDRLAKQYSLGKMCIRDRYISQWLSCINPFSVQQRKVRLLITTQRFTLQPVSYTHLR